MEIISIIGVLLGFGIWWLKRRSARQDDPVEQNRKAHREAEKPITKPSVALDDALTELDRRERLRHGADRE